MDDHLPIPYQDLKRRFEASYRLGEILQLLTWDQRVVKPAAAGGERNDMEALLSIAADKYKSSAELEILLQQAEAERNELGEWDQRNLDQMHTRYTVPKDLDIHAYRAWREARGECRMNWARARAEKNWPLLAKPFSVQVNQLRLRYSYMADEHKLPNPYDVALHRYSRNWGLNELDGLVAHILPPIKELMQKHAMCPLPDPVRDMMLSPEQKLLLMHAVAGDLGFDMNHGRIDFSAKGFFSHTSTDRRIVLPSAEQNSWRVLSAGLHETGHALHYQHLPRSWITQPIGTAGDFCMREAMALIWQFFVGQTYEYCVYLSEKMNHLFHCTLPPSELYRAYHPILPKVTRTGSDPVSYALHIIIRYRIERDLINDEMEVADIPARWNRDYQDLLGVTVADDGEGCLQDIHWYKGSFGYFPCYLLALLYAAQLYAQAQKDVPGLVAGFAKGEFKPMRDWLDERVYSWANFHDGRALLAQATGEELNPQYFLDYLAARYPDNV